MKSGNLAQINCNPIGKTLFGVEKRKPVVWGLANNLAKEQGCCTFSKINRRLYAT